MKPKICLSIDSLSGFSFDKYNFEGYEIRGRSSEFSFNIVKFLDLKERFKDYDLSLHSQLSRIFSCNDKNVPEFAEAELNILKAEIIACGIIGIKQLIFHSKQEPLNEEEKKEFREIFDFAKEKGVEMIFESNGHPKARVALQFLEDFPDINYCLDFGHINLALENDQFGMELMEFIDKIKDRIVHIHAHNNDGARDQHFGIDKGTFPWKKVLDKLKDSSKLRKIVIESRPKGEDGSNYILETQKILQDYYSDK